MERHLPNKLMLISAVNSTLPLSTTLMDTGSRSLPDPSTPATSNLSSLGEEVVQQYQSITCICNH